MNKDRSAARIALIVSEYLKQIGRYKEKYRSHSNFPLLSNEEFDVAFRRKKIEVRSHYRLLALAVLTEYISTRLNGALSKRLGIIIDNSAREGRKFELEEPLIFLLSRLHVNNEEIDSEVESADQFEAFLILEREFRQEKKFKELLYSIDEKNSEYLAAFTIYADRDGVDHQFWNGQFAGVKLSGDLVSNEDVLMKTIDLLNFLNELSVFLRSVRNNFLASCYWFYFRHFFNAVQLILPYLQTFFKASNRLVHDSWLARRAALSDEEVRQLIQNIEKAGSDINWLLDVKQHSALADFIRLFSSPQEVYVTIGGELDEGAKIDMDELRNAIRKY